MKTSISAGKPYPFGATIADNGINFAIAAKEAEKISLLLFDENNQKTPIAEFSLNPQINKTGDVWHIKVEGLPECVVYGYRLASGDGKSELLLDPYATSVASDPKWRNFQRPYRPLGKVVQTSSFDWEGDLNPSIPLKDLIIYEMHVRGFTQDPSSEVSNPGTYLGLIEKIPYLKDLGVNAVELLPIHEFNENEAVQTNPKTKERLCNYFGYSTVNFFSPMNRYASRSGRDQALVEFKTMVKEFHKHGIEVILDVVYNHTFEGNAKGPVQSYRGIDKSSYYMIDPQGEYLNFTGCGNTFNANHPLTRELILSSLRYWVTEMHVDGFRFDLASALTRSENGTPLPNPPLIEAISLDPILSKVKLIAEAWDAAGLYQVGGFYPGTRWCEWNGKYRDVVRRFIKGTPGQKTAFATAISGSQDLYGWRNSPLCSVNFVTAHDGFSLADLVSFNHKHNLNNGENNRDGFDHNESWNCGVEGHSINKKIVRLRERQIRNFFLALMISQGIPMVLMGDEYAHSRHGNNNTWCQDNELNWFLWNRFDNRPGFFRFFKSLIEYRKTHPIFKKDLFLTDQDVSWHGVHPFQPEWDNENCFIAFTLNDESGAQIYVAFNADHVMHTITVPPAGNEKSWRWVVNTHQASPDDFFEETQRPRLPSNTLRIPSYSAILLERENGA